MNYWIVIVPAALVFLVVAALAFRKSPMARAMEHARRTGEVGPLVTAIEDKKGDRATTWNRAITELWESYARETAAVLIVEAARRSEADIVQYWIQRVLEVEPEIAEAAFDAEFLAEYFRPEVASRCGRRGCCG